MWNANQSRPGFELVSPCPFPTTITITPRVPPFSITDSGLCIYNLSAEPNFIFMHNTQWITFPTHNNQIGWSCKIHRLHFYSGVRSPPSPQRLSRIWHETASDGEVPVLEIWRMSSTSSLSLLPGPLWLSDSTWQGPIDGLNITNYECKKWRMLNCDCYIAILETI